MLSAVETFGGTATAAAHNPFAIAAAAVVMPTQNHLQQSGQVSLEHYTIGHSTLLSTHHHHHNHHHHQNNNNNNNSHNQQHHRNNFNHHQILSNQSTSGGLFPVYSSSSSSSSPSSTSCSPPINQNKSKSPRLNTSDCNSEIIAMSSTEFVRPHPKQPRYSTANNNNNNNINNNNNSNFGNNNNNINNNNNNIGSNGIPLQIRNNKIGNNNNTIGCNNNSAGTKSSIGRQRKYSAEPQSGPVNLVTNNNNNNNSIKNNNNNSNNNNGCRLSSPNELVEINGNNVIGCGTGNGIGIPLLQQKQNSSPQLTGGGSTLNDNDVISALYSQKLPFATAPTVVSNAIAAAAAYQFNYPHIYARSPYGTPALYPSNHSLNSRIQQLQNAYIGSTHPNDLTFSPYLPTSIQQYNNNNNTIVTGSLNILQKPPPPLSPTNLITSGVVNSNNNNSLNNNNSRIIQQHYTMAQQQPTNPLPHIMEQTQQRSSMLHLNHHSDKELITTKNSLLSSYSTHNISNSSNNNTKLPMSLSSAGFKIPSGKDGSLKHRFLTRPTTENDQKKQKSQITTTILRSSNINTNAPSNFTKGSFIELCNGVLRKVEDMRTEDFIQSAERSQYHQLADSTVVKISSNTNNVIITFCYDKNKLKADVEVSLEHPFFVYGQGWASCNPELSLQTFGLKCQRLQVGDVCISLISRDETTTTTYNSPQPTYYKDNNNIDPLPPSFYPQNLSRKSHQSPTILTSSTGVAVSSRLSIPPPSPSSSSTLQVAAVYLPLSHVPPYDLHSYESKLSSLQNSVIGGSNSELISIYPKHAHGHEISRKSHTISEIVNSESTKSANAAANYQLTNKTNNKDDIQGQDLTTNNISNNNNNSSHDEPIDVSLSRKRKCDDNEDFK